MSRIAITIPVSSAKAFKYISYRFSIPRLSREPWLLSQTFLRSLDLTLLLVICACALRIQFTCHRLATDDLTSRVGRLYACHSPDTSIQRSVYEHLTFTCSYCGPEQSELKDICKILQCCCSHLDRLIHRFTNFDMMPPVSSVARLRYLQIPLTR